MFPHASPRLVVQIGFLALFAGIVIMISALEVGAGPQIVTWPMLLAGLGIGALASQLGSVTVSSVPDEQSGEVGGKAGVSPQTANAILKENEKARVDGLRASLSLLAIIALIALFTSRRMPTRQPSGALTNEPPA